MIIWVLGGVPVARACRLPARSPSCCRDVASSLAEHPTIAVRVSTRAIDRYDAVGSRSSTLGERPNGRLETSDVEPSARAPAGRCTACPSASRSCSTSPAPTQSYGSRRAGRHGGRTRDAAVVAALRDAGAVVVGTTRTHEFGWGITTQHADPRVDAQPVGPRPRARRFERDGSGRRGRRRASCRSPSAATPADRSGSQPPFCGVSG